MAEGFDKLFGLDVSDDDVGKGTFEDTQDLMGANKGQKSASPPDTGQKTDSRSVDQKVDDLNKDTKTPDDSTKDGDDKGKKDAAGKDLPFDQHPKWKSARTAEKFLQEFMDEKGILDYDELKEAFNSGQALRQALGDQDVEEILQNSDAYREYERRMEEEELNDPDQDDQTPENEKLAKVLRENQELRVALTEIQEAQAEDEADVEAFSHYTSDVDKILDIMSEEVPLTEAEQTLFKSVMGIENPSTEVNIDNRPAVRTMVKDAARQFKTTLDAIKQQHIDDIAAGKKKMQVTDPSQTGDLDATVLNKKNYDPDKQSVDEVLDSGKEELFDLLKTGLENAR